MTLYSRQAGAGSPLVLLHGLFGSLENLGTLARSFSEKFCVYSVDLPNHGRSDHSDEISLPLLAEAVVAWMDANNIKQADFVGHSLGGKTAMEIALRWPQRVNKLVVMDIAPVQYHAHHDDVFAGLLAIDPPKLESRQQAEKILAEHVGEIATRSFLLKNLVRNDDGKFAWRMNLPVLYRDYDKLLMGNSEGKFHGPALFLRGELSDYVQEKHREEILKRFPNANSKTISGTQHWLHAEKPDLVSKAILRFLDGT